jgi:hypothetical protein
MPPYNLANIQDPLYGVLNDELWAALFDHGDVELLNVILRCPLSLSPSSGFSL